MLNDLRIRQSKPRDRDYKLSDYEGLHLLVRPTGSKLWRLSYRFAGKQKLLALGLTATKTCQRHALASELFRSARASSEPWRHGAA